MTAPIVPTLIFGTAGFAKYGPEDVETIFAILESHDVKYIDTAYGYMDSEETLSKFFAPKKFIIDTKTPGFSRGSLSKESILKGMETSLQRLGVESVETYLIHAPDLATPIEETLSAINTIYSQGKFKYFGLSNFSAEGVQEVYDIQKSSGGVLPTVFQGNYNAVSRHIESTLLPLLRRLGISFSAYSPIAGGFLVKSAPSANNGATISTGRFAKTARTGEMYTTMYGKPLLLKALEEWNDIATEAGVSKVELAYRWVAWNSALSAEKGDALILGASKTSQLEESLTAIENGPLPEAIASRIDKLWESVKDEAPLDNFHSFGIKDQQVVDKK